ncbi:MAG: Co2+/Mg2+ efflux protein ApaG [Pseudarcicella sp.]|nr:Co2+/Mg2+ efflux protein ApaG [Pseudarcicella sp.]MBP6409585.1 Co2+/Mg2+ efflux protein ApaG [Pseudarcicella sp.]
MITATTHGIKVSVETRFQPEYSSPSQEHFVFSYHIKIENKSNFTFKLLRRHWYITDLTSQTREVEGEGVVGVQPTLEPEQAYNYTSACNLSSSIGKMNGTYQMERIMDGKIFEVEIPDFTLIVPHLLN